MPRSLKISQEYLTVDNAKEKNWVRVHKYALEKLYFFGIIKNEPKLDGVASFNYGVPMATFQLHQQTLITIEYQSTRQEESNEPKLDGVASFKYGVPTTFQLHHQTLLPYSIKVRQEESNEPKLDGVASFNYGVPMATFQLHHQTLVTI
ncbi:hypothetical protein EVAR_83805_1 [Eumeta japonica]|uniref:Uncharacterized protein n=1 Tax=Eumeta variegata TaxID=151549 RepID=A0A4C1WEN0_EUMVA|nr:hypothetical protein EVAR_83805_1 [Eumeta japonica]